MLGSSLPLCCGAGGLCGAFQVGSPRPAFHVLAQGGVYLQAPFAVEGLLSRSLGIKSRDGLVRGERSVAAGADRLGRFQMLHRVSQPSHQRPPSNVFRCFGVNKHLHLHGARPIGVSGWRASVGDIRRRLQRRHLALLLVFQNIGEISPSAQANFRSTKPRVGPFMIFTIGFLDQQKSTRSRLLVSDGIVVISARNFRIVGCFVYRRLCRCFRAISPRM